jgi:predicted nucleic acid-binding Zn ribbon protein
MPLYDYKCPIHGVQEILKGINDTTPELCQEADNGFKCEELMEKVFSAGKPAFLLIGSGFYTTDNNKGATPK